MIAHVIGASVLGHFVWDETAYLLLDIGFIWNIYLDGEMGLVPQTLALTSFARRSARISKRSSTGARSQSLADPVGRLFRNG